MKTFSGISLFSGAGGMDVGFSNAGIKIELANELNSDAAETYIENHRNSKLLFGDIINYYDKFSQYQNIDIVFGGPPCQGFSVAGKMDPNDSRSQMIWAFLKAVEVVQPKVFVMENVKALGQLEKWADIRNNFIKKATSLGYNCNFIIANAADFGVPQNRERVFFIGSKGKTRFNDFLSILETYKTTPVTLREVFNELPPAGSEENPLTCTAKITLASKPVMRRSPYAGMIFNGMGRPLNLNSVCSTLPASMGGNKTPIIDEDLIMDPNGTDWVKEYHGKLLSGSVAPTFGSAPNHLRRLTIKEASKIQTFPDNYTFKGSKSSVYAQIGNAVPCKLAESIACSVIKAYLN